MALVRFEPTPFDVLVTDINLKGMDGVELLRRVRNRYPDTIRIAFCSHADKETALFSSNIVHQVLLKPILPEALFAKIGQTLELRQRLASKKLRQLIAQIGALPSLPVILEELHAELLSKESSMRRIGEIIGRDAGMTTKILQLVNSAFFSVPQSVSSPGQAVVLLGMETVKALVLVTQLFTKFDVSQTPGFSIDELWQHSLLVGELSRRIASGESTNQRIIDQAYLAGLLHDCGKLVLACRVPEQMVWFLAKRANLQKTPEFHRDVERLEREVFGATHAEVGAFLMSLWGFADPVVQAILFHHSPNETRVSGLSPIVAVHVANALAGQSQGQHLLQVDEDFLASIGLLDRLPDWTQIQTTFG